MSYLAEEQIWYDGGHNAPTTFYGFFLSYGDWDMTVVPFTSEEDRDYVLDNMRNWALTDRDAHHAAALVTAWVEAIDEAYLTEAIDILGADENFNPDAFDRFVNTVHDDVWGKP
jgi:hypothetical protein